MNARRIATRVVAALAAVIAAIAVVPRVGSAQSSYERGPDPTRQSIEAARGPFATASEDVSRFRADGFGGGTITYPLDTSEGTFGVVAVSPGFTASESSIAWLGPRIASQGFVVITIDTNSRFDYPSSRGDQLLAALEHVVEDASASVRSRVDATRLAVMGHSMGGGGSLEAASDDGDLRAAVPLQPWNLDKTWGEVDTPTLIIGAENDTIASVGSHSIPFYNSLGGEKAYLELNNASHFVANYPDATLASYSISWLKRFVDDDTRYTQFLCGPNHELDIDISDWRDTCPF